MVTQISRTAPRPVLKLVRECNVGRDEYKLPAPWTGAIDGWIAWLKTGGSSLKTRDLRRTHVRSIAKWSGTHHPRQLTVDCLVRIFSERNWGNEHRRGMRCSLVSFCEWAHVQGVMDSNPALHLPKVPGENPRPYPAPDAVWADLLAAAPPRERMMARLAGEAGMRRGEVAQCRLDDLINDGGRWALIVRGKGNKQRVVPITDNLADAVRRYCSHGYLFPSPNGGHLNEKWVGACISRLMPPGMTMHKLRHRYASRGFAKTRNIVAVSKALGHSSIATTQRYVAITDDEVRAVSEAAADDDPDDIA